MYGCDVELGWNRKGIETSWKHKKLPCWIHKNNGFWNSTLFCQRICVLTWAHQSCKHTCSEIILDWNIMNYKQKAFKKIDNNVQLMNLQLTENSNASHCASSPFGITSACFCCISCPYVVKSFTLNSLVHLVGIWHKLDWYRTWMKDRLHCPSFALQWC